MASTHSEACSSSEVCDLVRAIRSVGSEWSLIIPYYLLDGPKGFNELLRAGKSDELNSRTLSRTLKVLLNRGIVDRRVVNTQPFAVSYSLTDKGRALESILDAFGSWARNWIAPVHETAPSQVLHLASGTRKLGN